MNTTDFCEVLITCISSERYQPALAVIDDFADENRITLKKPDKIISSKKSLKYLALAQLYPIFVAEDDFELEDGLNNLHKILHSLW